MAREEIKREMTFCVLRLLGLVLLALALLLLMRIAPSILSRGRLARVRAAGGANAAGVSRSDLLNPRTSGKGILYVICKF